MKKTYMKAALVAGLLSALVIVGTACTNDDEATMPESQESGMTSFTAVWPDNGATTRLALDGSAIDNPTNPHIRVTWETGEEVKLFTTSTGNYIYTIATGAGTKEASFTGGALAMMQTYTIYGPADLISAANFADVAFDYRGQTQTADNDISHLRDYSFYSGGSISGSMPPNQTTSIPNTRVFTHLGALMQVKLTIPEDITGLTAFTIASASNIWCKAGAGGMGNAYEPDFTLTLDEFDATAANGLNLWMMLPANANDINIPAGTLSLSLTNGTTTFTKDVTINENKKFAAGGWYVLEAELEGPPVTGLDGGGVDGNPFLIHNAAELRFMRDKINDYDMDYMYAFYRLENDITVGDESWLTAGSFAGDLDGNNKTISGITRPLFEGGIAGQQPPTMRYPTVKNLHFRDANISMGDGEEVYGIVGSNGGIVTGCSVQGTLTQTQTGRMNVYAGGIAKVNDGTITGCWVNITEFTLQSAIVGQNAGYIVCQNYGTVEDNAWVTVSSGFIPNVDHSTFGTGYPTYEDLESGFLTPP